MTRKKRILSWIAGIALMIGIYLWFFGDATGAIITTRWMAYKSPILREVPIELSDRSQHTAVGQPLSYLGYNFTTPWGEIDTARVRTFPNAVVLPLRSGPVMEIRRMPPDGLVKEVLSWTKSDQKRMDEIYGAGAMSSDYAFTKLMLGTTPSQIGLLSPKRDCVGKSILLLFKGIATPTDSGLFVAHSGELQGFQYGDPGRGKRVIVDLWAPDHGIEFLFFPAKDGPPLAQADINEVLQSLRPDEANSSGAGK